MNEQGKLFNYNPLSVQAEPSPSPEEERAIELQSDENIAARISKSRQIGPSVRQQTQSEIINLALLYRELGGNPFNVRRVPFTVLRDMTSDGIIAYSFYYTVNPLITAEKIVHSEDSLLAAAVDAAFRPIMPEIIMQMAQALFYGYAPLVERWRLGPMEAKYRDKYSDDPSKDRDVWKSNVDMILPKAPIGLAPENCIPQWDETGEFDGFMFSPVPIPNPLMLGIAQTYGPSVLSGYPIPKENALWIVNEKEENFGSCYGQPRSRRAYRLWWSKWMRWAWADRWFENNSDPTKIVHYPTDVAEAFDVNDPNSENPTPRMLEQKAIQVGRNVRPGATVALPGTMMRGDDGKTLNVREWEIKYLESNTTFDHFSKTFSDINTELMLAFFLPQQAFLDSNVTGQGSSQRYVATQMGEIYQESQQFLIDSFMSYVNKYMVPKFVAANFPDKIKTPVEFKTGTLGAKNDEINKQIITLIAQKDPAALGVDPRALLAQYGIPLLTKQQQDVEMAKAAERAKLEKPEVRPPGEKEGMQGYNAGVEKTEMGEHIYVSPPQVLTNLSSGTHQDFLASLPAIPPYENPAVRSSALRIRKLMLDRYKKQVKTFADRLRDKITMGLAEEPENTEHRKLGAGASKLAAEGAVAAWVGTQLADRPEVSEKMQSILSRVVLASGKGSLKQANLDQSVYEPKQLDNWVTKFADENLNSIDHTLREEFIEFLTEKFQDTTDPENVAQSFEEHFAELPQTHADRIARYESGEAYNKGMAQAAIDSGISQLMMHDASEGNNTQTDKACLARNGKVISAKEALQEKKLHPNCTLFFDYLTTENLSLNITNEIPDNLLLAEDSPGVYDSKTETLYVREKYSDGAADWMLALGTRLSF